MNLDQLPPVQPPAWAKKADELVRRESELRRVLKPDRTSPAVVSVLTYDRMTTHFALAMLAAIILGCLLMVQSLRLGDAKAQADHARLRLAAHEEFLAEQRRGGLAALYHSYAQTNETSKVESAP